MNEDALPGCWVWTRLGDISDLIHYGYTASSTTEPVGLKMLRITDIQNNCVNWEIVPYCKIEGEDRQKYLLKDGDLVFARTGATVGKSFLIKGKIPEAVFASYLIRIILSDNVEKEFVYNFFQSSKYWLQIREGQLGIGQPNVNSQILSRIVLPLPPLPEQRRIVTKIEELFTKLDAGVEALKKTQAELKRYRQSVLKAACEGKLVPTEAELARAEGRAYEPADVLLAHILKERREKSKGAKYKEPAAPDISELSALPEGWGLPTYEQIGEWSGGGTPSTRNSSYWYDGTIPWISPKDMKTLRILDSEDKITETALENSAAKIIPAGSILFVVRSGILRRILPVALTLVDVAVNQDLKALTPHGSINVDYLLITALSFNEDIRHSCAKDGTTVESIEVPALQIYTIPLPPLAEQRRIVAEVERRLSVADEVARTVEQSLAQAQRLRQSILKKAFEGRLVAQDENDEPASVLLERIKAGKERKKNKREQ